MYGPLTLEEAERRAYANGNTKLADTLRIVEGYITDHDDMGYSQAHAAGVEQGKHEAFVP